MSRHLLIALGLALASQLMACNAAEAPQARAALPAPPHQVDLLAEINALRLSRGRSELVVSAAAVQAAGRHAADLQRTGGLSHSGSDGSSPGERLSREGQAWCSVAENLARGQKSEAEVLADWLDSPRHRANMLGRYTALGTARAGDVWVAVFLSPC